MMTQVRELPLTGQAPPSHFGAWHWQAGGLSFWLNPYRALGWGDCRGHCHWQDWPCTPGIPQGWFLAQGLGCVALLGWLALHRTRLVADQCRFLFDWPELPFRPRPSQHLLPMPEPHQFAALPLLEDWGLASRLCHPDQPGAYPGSLQQLLAYWRQQASSPCPPIWLAPDLAPPQPDIVGARSLYQIPAFAPEHFGIG